MNIKQVLNEEISNIRPQPDETRKLENFAKDFISLLNKNKLRAQIGGSLAKGTMIKKSEKQDIDIFVIFDFSEDILKLGKILEKIKLPGKLKKVHGSRDYFQIECVDTILEIIPVIENKDPALAENVTDVSLSHVKFVRGEIEKNLELADEIRLAKAFCRGQGCYGAESYIKGFSGYTLEILVIYFGSFVNFLKGIPKKKIIDPKKYFRSDREILRELNSSKLTGPLILIDPTYKYRNVAAGLGQETFTKFLSGVKLFLKSPSLDYFEPKRISIEELKSIAEKNKAKLVEVNLSTEKQEGDIAGSKMRKFFDFFTTELSRKQQEILTKDFYYPGKGKLATGFIIIKEKKEIEIRGPSIGLEKAVENFKKSRREIYRKGKFYYVKENTSIKEIFNSIKKVEKEMNVEVGIKLI